MISFVPKQQDTASVINCTSKGLSYWKRLEKTLPGWKQKIAEHPSTDRFIAAYNVALEILKKNEA